MHMVSLAEDSAICYTVRTKRKRGHVPMLGFVQTVEREALAARRALPAPRLEELLAGVGRGEGPAFEELYRSTDRMIYAYALSLLRNHHDAQDVMMDAYLKIRSGAHLYRPQGKPLAWIFTSVRNLARSRQRGAGREELLGDLDEPVLAFDPGDSSDDVIVLRQAIKSLGGEERQIVMLHAVTGLKHREIAELLELPLSTVLSKYSRALLKLRKILANEEEVGA